jgi:Tubulin/FtsZ family, GTPase domain
LEVSVPYVVNATLGRHGVDRAHRLRPFKRQVLARERGLRPVKSAIQHLLFIVAGTGGGTGSGVSGVLAEVARAESAFTVGVVTRSFRFEGRVRNRTATTGLEHLRAVPFRRSGT